MSTPKENPNPIQNLEVGTFQDSEILKKLNQLFRIRTHEENSPHLQTGQEYQTSLLNLMRQYYTWNKNNTVINNMWPQIQPGMPMMQAPLTSNICVNNFYFNLKNSYNYHQINNQTINNNMFSLSNREILKAVYSQAASKIAQNPLHFYPIENNKENRNNLSTHKSNLKYSEISQSHKNCGFDKKNQYVSKKRSREDEKLPNYKSIKGKKKSAKKYDEISGSPYSNQTENKTDDSETNNLLDGGKGNRIKESVFVGCESLEETNEDLDHSSEISADKDTRISASNNPHGFMKNHFPKIYINPDNSNFKDTLDKKNNIHSKQYFLFPYFLENLNICSSSDSPSPKKIWTSNCVDCKLF
jgi:hypothetical protein